MNPGDKVKVKSARDKSFQIMTVIEVLEESVKLKHPDIGGYFIISLTFLCHRKDIKPRKGLFFVCFVCLS